jgi:tetratricopeptide (TPR) repeat protein
MAALSLFIAPVGAMADSGSSHDEGDVQSDYLTIYLKLNDTAEQEAKGDLTGALAGFEDCYTRLGKIHKEYPHWENALINARMGDCEARIVAIEARLAATQKKPSAPAPVAPAIGATESLDAFKHAITLDPNNGYAHNFLGCALMRKDRVESAAKEFRAAIALNEGITEAHYNLAILYATEDSPALSVARAHYKRALELGLIPDPHLAKLLHVAQD